MHKICHRYALNLLNIGPRYDHAMSLYDKIYPTKRYVQNIGDMFMICVGYAQGISNIYSRYAQDMPQICSKFA